MRFDQGLIDRSLLAGHEAKLFGRQGDVKIALGAAKHQRLLRILPFELGRVGRDLELAALSVAFTADERLANGERDARARAIGDGRVEGDSTG